MLPRDLGSQKSESERRSEEIGESTHGAVSSD